MVSGLTSSEVLEASLGLSRWCEPEGNPKVSVSIPPLAKSNDWLCQSDVQIITKVLPSQAPFRAVLPGSDLQPEGCQEPVAHFCNECGHSFWVASSCNERGCPVCYEKWAWIEAGKASRRIWTKRASLREQGIYSRVLHIVVSLRYDGESYEQLKVLARRVLRVHGVNGELMIYHQWREDNGEWLFDGTAHFHCVVVATGDIEPGLENEDVPGYGNGHWGICVSNEPQQVPKVIFKVIQNPFGKPYGGVKKLYELRKLIQYQLSHCSILPNKHSVVWSGTISYRNWSTEQVDQYPGEPIRGACCPACSSRDTERCRQYVPDWGLDWVHPYPSEPPPPARRVLVVWK